MLMLPFNKAAPDGYVQLGACASTMTQILVREGSVAQHEGRTIMDHYKLFGTPCPA